MGVHQPAPRPWTLWPPELGRLHRCRASHTVCGVLCWQSQQPASHTALISDQSEACCETCSHSTGRQAPKHAQAGLQISQRKNSWPAKALVAAAFLQTPGEECSPNPQQTRMGHWLKANQAGARKSGRERGPRRGRPVLEACAGRPALAPQLWGTLCREQQSSHCTLGNLQAPTTT